MHYIAKQAKTRQNIGRDIGGEVPYIGYRNRQISGKRTIPVYANITRLHAPVSAPSKTVSTAATDKISFATYHATCADIVDVATNFFYERPTNSWPITKGIGMVSVPTDPVIDMEACSIDGGATNRVRHFS